MYGDGWSHRRRAGGQAEALENFQYRIGSVDRRDNCHLSLATRAATGYGKPVTSTMQASFKAPGVYVLRAIASDGLLEAFHDVTVTVNK